MSAGVRTRALRQAQGTEAQALRQAQGASRQGLTRWVVLALVGAFLVGAAIGLLLGPASPRLSQADTGGFALAADVRSSLVDDRGFASLSAARVSKGEVEFAGIAGQQGEPPTRETPYELGSITKTFTGLLLADAAARGELRLEDPLSTHLPELAGTPVGAATLRQLATHTAGLPAFPDAATPRVLLSVVANENTYDGSTAAMLDATRTTKVTEPGTYRYSNLGMALLGHAEARAAGVPDWPTLATRRILTPLGLTHTHFAMTQADVPADAAPPHADNGWPAANWYGPAFAPAGSSTLTTAEDMATYARALLDGTAPGVTAMDPLQPIPSGQIGLAWHEREVAGHAITWHNGGTGGYRTILALDRARGQAVIILSNSTRDADAAGLRLAATAPGTEVTPVDRLPVTRTALVWPLVGLAFWLSFAYGVLRSRTRLAVVTAVLTGVTGLLALLVHGPWAFVPGWVWGGLVAASVVLAVAGLRRCRGLPAYAERRRFWGWLSLALTLAVLGLVAWTT